MGPLVMSVGVALSFLSLQVLGTVYVTDHAQRRIIELKGRTQPCIVYNDRDAIEKMLQGVGIKYIQKMSANDLDALSNSCRDMDQINKRGGFIYPGTHWCGPGNIASSYNDLGPLTEEDKCCRDHDHCPNQLEPGQCRQGICNISPFTRSHCDCDNAFKRCLREVNSDAANTIGTLFFNIVQVTCFKDRRPCPQYMRGCRKMQFHGMTPFISSKMNFYLEKEDFVSNFVTGLLSEFLRFGNSALKRTRLDDSSYTWFCDEWKFELSGEFNTSLVTREQPAFTPTYHIPDKPENVNSEPLPTSNIDKNLQRLFETEPNAKKIMESGKHSNSGKKANNQPPAIFNSIPDGKLVWRA